MQDTVSQPSHNAKHETLASFCDKNQTIVNLVRILFIAQFIAIGLLHQVDSFSITCFIMTLFYFCQTPINPLASV